MSKFESPAAVYRGSRSALARRSGKAPRSALPPRRDPSPTRSAVPAELRAHDRAPHVALPDHRSAVLPALRAAQWIHAALGRGPMLQVAWSMRVTPPYLESVASFYDMLELEPVGAAHDLRLHQTSRASCAAAARPGRGIHRGHRLARQRSSSRRACSAAIVRVPRRLRTTAPMAVDRGALRDRSKGRRPGRGPPPRRAGPGCSAFPTGGTGGLRHGASEPRKRPE